MSSLVPPRIGPYAIVREIGRGGMGVVYLARDERLDRHVAIKALPDELAHDRERLERFEREAKLLASLNHPNIASIHGLEQVAERQYLILEYVEGVTLADRLKGGAFSVDEALPIALQIAQAVSAAHEKGIVHRDLKPANIKLTSAGQIKVLDFGLAKASEPISRTELADSPTVTMPHSPTIAGAILGTAAYMSPEQTRGWSVDERTDIWAFGVVLYEMLTGLNPFAGDTASDSIGATLHRDPDWNALPAELAPQVKHVLARCLAKDRRQRLHDIADARLEIEEAIADPASAFLGLAAGGERGRSSTGRRRGTILVAVAFAAMVTGAVIRDAFEPPRDTTRDSAVTRFTVDLPAASTLGFPGGDMDDLAISRNGRTLAFVVAQANHGTEIHVRDLNSFDSRPVAGTQGGTQPCFSPDGQWLGFFSGGRLMKVSLAGGSPITICSVVTATGCTWIDDETIVWAGSPPHALMRVNAGGGEPTRFASLVDDTRLGGALSMTAVPGKRSVLVAGWHANTIEAYDIVAVSLDDGRATTVIENAVNPFVLDSGHLVFQRVSSFLATRWEPDGLAVTGPVAPVLQGVATSAWGDDAQAFVSASGTLVFVPGDRHGPGRRLAWVDRLGNRTPISERRDAFVGGLRFSPDGSRLVLATLRNSMEMWTYELARDGMARLTHTGDTGAAVWSPDGQRVAYQVFDVAHGLPDGIRIESLTRPGEARSYLPGQYWEPQDWTDDGTRLLVTGIRPVSDDGPAETGLAVWEPEEGRQPELIVRGLEPDAQVRLSPDDQWIAYVKLAAGRKQVFVRRFPDTGEEWQVSVDGGRKPEWSPAGDRIYFLAGGAIMSVQVATATGFRPGTPVELFDAPWLVEEDSYDVAPDGRLVVIELADWELEPVELHVVHNWSSEIERRLASAGR